MSDHNEPILQPQSLKQHFSLCPITMGLSVEATPIHTHADFPFSSSSRRTTIFRCSRLKPATRPRLIPDQEMVETTLIGIVHCFNLRLRISIWIEPPYLSKENDCPNRFAKKRGSKRRHPSTASLLLLFRSSLYLCPKQSKTAYATE